MSGGSAYDELPDGVVVTDGTGTVLTVNAAAARLIGQPAAALCGSRLAEALPLRDPQGRDWWECVRPYDGLVTRVRQPERLLSIARPAGEDTPVLVTARFVRDTDRSVTRFVVCLRDTTARVRHERSGAELVSVVAHELRSPLTSVKGFTATLLTKWDRFTDDQKRLMLQTVNSDADRLTRLISELLDVSRIETGRLELHKQVVDVPGIVRRDVEARIAAGAAVDRFRLQLDGPHTEVWADPDKVAQVVGNIVENALRHGDGRVSVDVRPAGDGVEVAVTDEGEGIPSEALPRIFGKFWRGSKRGGTGLGLFIAKGIVDAHGGTITAQRAATGGAVVGFTLPAGTPSFAETDDRAE